MPWVYESRGRVSFELSFDPAFLPSLQATKLSHSHVPLLSETVARLESA